jgi:hypothetical protein
MQNIDKPETNKGSQPIPDEAINRGDNLGSGEMSKEEVTKRITPTREPDADGPGGTPGNDSDRTYSS